MKTHATFHLQVQSRKRGFRQTGPFKSGPVIQLKRERTGCRPMMYSAREDQERGGREDSRWTGFPDPLESASMAQAVWSVVFPPGGFFSLSSGVSLEANGLCSPNPIVAILSAPIILRLMKKLGHSRRSAGGQFEVGLEFGIRDRNVVRMTRDDNLAIPFVFRNSPIFSSTGRCVRFDIGTSGVESGPAHKAYADVTPLCLNLDFALGRIEFLFNLLLQLVCIRFCFLIGFLGALILGCILGFFLEASVLIFFRSVFFWTR